MNSQRDTVIDLFTWRRGNKEFALRYSFAKNDTYNMFNWYTVYFLNKTNGYIISRFTGNRFTDFRDNSYYSFCRTLESQIMAREIFEAIHKNKVDILAGNVVQV